MLTETAVTELIFAEAPAWTPEALKRISDEFEGRYPEDILRWGIEKFGEAGRAPDWREGLALATGFGPEGVVLMHLVSRIAPETTVFYLDTDLLFPETYALKDEIEARLGLSFTRVSTGLTLAAQAADHGEALWARDPNLCCQLRKVEPLRRFLAGRRAWVTGIRRDQTRQRAAAGLAEWDRANGLVKINPLAGWTSDQVWAHIHLYDLPFNPLHEHGYPSIGCWPCTRPAAEGGDPRSGRWAGFGKTECGIHLGGRGRGGRP